MFWFKTAPKKTIEKFNKNDSGDLLHRRLTRECGSETRRCDSKATCEIQHSESSMSFGHMRQPIVVHSISHFLRLSGQQTLRDDE